MRVALTPLKAKQTADDDIDEAIRLVVSLAEQNIIDRLDNPREYRRQSKAVRLVKETFGIYD
jgi:hypothetical protein